MNMKMKKQLIFILLIASLSCVAQTKSNESAFEGYVEGQDENKALPGFAAVGSGFNYQGELIDAGSAANTNYDFAFQLYDAATGFTQIGSNVVKGNRPVINGLFSIEGIDFGDAAYSGDELWLSVTVRETGNPGSETTLSPRQKINAVPYAVQADYLGPVGASNGDILKFTGGSWGPSSAGSVSPWSVNGTSAYYNSGNVGIGTNLPQAELMVDADNVGDAFRVRVSSSTKLYVNANGGTGIGGWTTPPSDGLFVSGDVKQPLASNGVMKYMAYVKCGSGSSVTRQYNGINSSLITATGASTGQCVIDFPTNMDERFWQVSVVYGSHSAVGQKTANCRLETSSTDKLFCNVTRLDNSTFSGGSIMVLIY